MAAITTSDWVNMLLSLYPEGAPENLAMENYPGWGIIPKSTGWTGNDWPVPMIVSRGAGRSATIANAVSSSIAPASGKFQMTRKRDFAQFLLDLEAMEASQGDENSMANLLEEQIGSKFNSLGMSIGTAAYRDGTGAIGQVTDTASVPTLKFVNDEGLKYIEVGTVLVASTGSTKTAATRAAGTNSMTVTAIDYSAKTFTVGAGITGLADNDWLFVEGDRQAAQITAHSMCYKLAGFDAWLDPTVGALTAADAFFGQVRTGQPKMVGHLITTAYPTVSQALVDLQSEVNEEPGARVDNILITPASMRRLKEEIDSSTTQNKTVAARVSDGLKAVVSFNGVVIDGDKGPITVMQDICCRPKTAYALTTKSWEIKSLGGMPRFMNPGEAKDLLRQLNTISFEGMLGYFGNMACKAPCWNGRHSGLPA